MKVSGFNMYVVEGYPHLYISQLALLLRMHFFNKVQITIHNLTNRFLIPFLHVD
jgi:hypothetical protein